MLVFGIAGKTDTLFGVIPINAGVADIGLCAGEAGFIEGRAFYAGLDLALVISAKTLITNNVSFLKMALTAALFLS